MVLSGGGTVTEAGGILLMVSTACPSALQRQTNCRWRGSEQRTGMIRWMEANSVWRGILGRYPDGHACAGNASLGGDGRAGNVPKP